MHIETTPSCLDAWLEGEREGEGDVVTVQRGSEIEERSEAEDRVERRRGSETEVGSEAEDTVERRRGIL